VRKELLTAKFAKKGRGVREEEAGQLCHQSSTIDDPHQQSPISNHNSLWHPIGDEDVGLVRSFGVAVRGPHQFFPVGTEHGEAIEAVAIGDAL
jgi:hypothetical protein